MKAARNTNAWIGTSILLPFFLTNIGAVDSGFDVGIAKIVGKAIRESDIQDVPCIGIAALNKVGQQQQLIDYYEVIFG